MKEDYVGEESIPEFDESEPENNEEASSNQKESEESDEPKKKSLREEDFLEFSAPKQAKKEDIIWHTGEESPEKGEEEKIEERIEEGKDMTSNPMESYEIKVKNYDEEKRKKKEKKKMEEGEEKKPKEEKKVIDRFMLLDYLFSFLEGMGDVNSTWAGYFAKVFMSFYNKKQKEVRFIFSFFFNICLM